MKKLILIASIIIVLVGAVFLFNNENQIDVTTTESAFESVDAEIENLEFLEEEVNLDFDELDDLTF